VVSGGAAGADTYAHQIALEVNAGTIVVVGSGLCHQYPPSNKLLFKRVIEQQGLIVSCFSMNIRPDVTTFPARNRIISGLSHGCLVVQAASKSGALITAQQALDQGREVFAIPGSIFDPLSAGCHDLIQQGAKVTTCSQDILIEFEKFKSVNVNNDSHFQMKLEDKLPISRLQRQDPLEQVIVTMLSIPMSSDHLLSKTKVNLIDLQSALFNLSLEGIIFQDGMGFWGLK
jgi:DNA processing protein